LKVYTLLTEEIFNENIKIYFKFEDEIVPFVVLIDDKALFILSDDFTSIFGYPTFKMKAEVFAFDLVRINFCQFMLIKISLLPNM
jgi:hypothetical protein